MPKLDPNESPPRDLNLHLLRARLARKRVAHQEQSSVAAHEQPLTHRWLVPILITAIGALCLSLGALFGHWAGWVTDELHAGQRVYQRNTERIDELARRLDDHEVRLRAGEGRDRRDPPAARP